jgi:hypothetical protein
MNEEKKHRHKWEQMSADCPQCGLGMYLECECGETRDINKKPL